MRIIIIAIGLAIIAAVVDYFVGIADPWKKIIFAGIVVLFVVGLILVFIPELASGRLVETEPPPFRLESASSTPVSLGSSGNL